MMVTQRPTEPGERRTHLDEGWPRGRNRQRGFTLVEMLAALVLTALVATLTARIVLQTVQAGQAMEQRHRARQRCTYALDRLADDLQARIRGTHERLIELDANHRPRIMMTSLVAPPGEAVFASRVPARVTYRLRQADEEAAGLEWIRQTDARVRGVPPTTTLVATGLVGIEAMLFDGHEWTALSAATEPREATPPVALRLTCRWAGDQETTTRVYALQDAWHESSKRQTRK